MFPCKSKYRIDPIFICLFTLLSFEIVFMSFKLYEGIPEINALKFLTPYHIAFTILFIIALIVINRIFILFYACIRIVLSFIIVWKLSYYFIILSDSKSEYDYQIVVIFWFLNMYNLYFIVLTLIFYYKIDNIIYQDNDQLPPYNINI